MACQWISVHVELCIVAYTFICMCFTPPASSEEEDEDILFSDDHIGSDSESGDNEQV